MPIKLSRNKSAGSVGLHIGTSHVAAVAIDRKRVVAAKSVDLEPGVVLDDRIAKPGALTEALREVCSDSAFGRQVYLGLGTQHGVVRVLEMPLIEDPTERDTAVRFQAAEAIAMPLEDVILDYAFIGQDVSPTQGARMRILLAAARRGRVYDLVECVRDAGLKPQGLELEPFALVRALAKPAIENEPARVYCHLGETATLVLAVGQACLLTRSAPITPSGFAEQLRLLLTYYASQPGSQPVFEVVVSGIAPTETDRLDDLGVPPGIGVRIAAPLGELDPETTAVALEDRPRFTLATGLALGASS
jgi:type IV pilus assembly protein PilM